MEPLSGVPAEFPGIMLDQEDNLEPIPYGLEESEEEAITRVSQTTGVTRPLHVPTTRLDQFKPTGVAKTSAIFVPAAIPMTILAPKHNPDNAEDNDLDDDNELFYLSSPGMVAVRVVPSSVSAANATMSLIYHIL